MNRLANGTKRRSYKTSLESMIRMPKMDKLASGILKEWDKLLSMVQACWMVKLCWYEDEVTSKIPATQIGNSRIMVFSSSTR